MRHVALVTGASRGIGAACALQLADDGYDVVLAARSVEDLEKVGHQVEQRGAVALVVPTDATDTGALEALVRATKAGFGRLDVLVNNAGVLPTATRSEQVTAGEFRSTLELNLIAPWFLACRGKELMASGDGGVVVNIASTAAFYSTVGYSVYNASKAALTMLTRTLALEWARDNVRVVGVAPGKVETAMVQPILDYSERKGMRLNPLGRAGQPAEVAHLVAFLASDRAAYMTGSIVTIDGGEVIASGADAAR
jgi:NAD(P)-dependent dehydrogenase (short-subunit alcohol dehydrogenase family)